MESNNIDISKQTGIAKSILENKVKNLEEKLKTANDSKNITTQTKS